MLGGRRRRARRRSPRRPRRSGRRLVDVRRTCGVGRRGGRSGGGPCAGSGAGSARSAASVSTVTCSSTARPEPDHHDAGRLVSAERDDGALRRVPAPVAAGRPATSRRSARSTPSGRSSAGRCSSQRDESTRPTSSYGRARTTCQPNWVCTGPIAAPGTADAAALHERRVERRLGLRQRDARLPRLRLQRPAGRAAAPCSIERSAASSAKSAPASSSASTSSASCLRLDEDVAHAHHAEARPATPRSGACSVARRSAATRASAAPAGLPVDDGPATSSGRSTARPARRSARATAWRSSSVIASPSSARNSLASPCTSSSRSGRCGRRRPRSCRSSRSLVDCRPSASGSVDTSQQLLELVPDDRRPADGRRGVVALRDAAPPRRAPATAASDDAARSDGAALTGAEATGLRAPPRDIGSAGPARAGTRRGTRPARARRGIGTTSWRASSL